MDHLADWTIVIIGGTTGLGLSGAKALVSAGAKVVIVGRNEDSAAAASQELGQKNAATLIADAMEPQTAPRAIQLALDRFGRFDGLYHVAGGSGRSKGDGPLHEITDEGIGYTIDLNLKSVLYSNRAAVQHFLEQRSGGVVLNMGSVLGWSPSPKHFSTHVYSATRGAIIGLTKAAAAYYAPYNIRFNVIAPALVETPMSQRAVGDPAVREFIHRKQPLDGGRIGVPSDLDAAVVFFLSDASKYVTGQVMAVDGGWTVSEGIPRS
jgi:NAD(P)-dependent dehydrogenase (short-subunit alcohol dehydrogenase family)